MLRVYTERNENKTKYRLRMTGHCNFDEAGKDIICAAASILCVTMAQVITENKDKLEEEPIVSLKSGDCLIEWQPKAKYNANFYEVLYTVITGLRWLEKHYPDCIKIVE